MYVIHVYCTLEFVVDSCHRAFIVIVMSLVKVHLLMSGESTYCYYYYYYLHVTY